ncbi:MAG: hypothetical protein JXA37_04935 [Chloroflexia bacterium]|nr:hypothetical protein [Chloroflexia bacterium]
MVQLVQARSIQVLLLFLLLLGVGALGASPPQAAMLQVDPWPPALNLSQTTRRTYFPQIESAAQSGDLWVVWTQVITGTQITDVWTRHRDGQAELWRPPENMSHSPYRDGGPTMYAQADGTVHLAWSQRSLGPDRTDLLYRRWDGSAWSEPILINRRETYHPSPYGLLFRLDGEGRLCLFVTIGSGVTYACLQPEGWESLRPWTYVTGMQSLGDIRWGPDGRFHVAALGRNRYKLAGPCDAFLQDAYYTSTDGQVWEPLTNLSYYGSIAYDLGLLFDRQGRLHFVWSDFHSYCSLDSERAAVYQRVLEGGQWGPRQELSTFNQGQAILDFALESDSLGRLHLAWSEGLLEGNGAKDLSIRYRRGDDQGGWMKEEILHRSTESSLNVDMALTRRGEPLLVWEEGASDAEEIYFSERRPPLYNVFIALVSGLEND